MSVVEHFREFRVYREAFESAMPIFEAQAVFDELDAAYEKVSGGLVNMMANADQGCISINQARQGGIRGIRRPNTPTHSRTHPTGHLPITPSISPMILPVSCKATTMR